MIRAIRYAWAAPASAVGLVAAAVAVGLGGRARIVDGVVEVGGGALGRWMRPGAGPLPCSAITFGHVVLGHDGATLARLRVHEHTHVRQYERWGVLFFPLYLGSSAWQWLRGRDAYRDNGFEVEAFLAADKAQASSHVTTAGAGSRRRRAGAGSTRRSARASTGERFSGFQTTDSSE